MPAGRPRLLRNIASLYVARGASLLSALIVFPLIAGTVGLEAYGVWLMINSLSYFFMTADLGMGTSVIRYVAEARAHGDEPRLNRVVTSTVAFFAGVGVLTALAFCAVFAAAWGGLAIPEDQRADGSVMVVLVAVCGLALGLPLGVFRQVLIGAHRADLANWILLGQVAIRLPGTVLVLGLGGGVLGIAALESAIVLWAGAAALVACRRSIPGFAPRPAAFDGPTLRGMLRFSAGVFVLGAAGVAVTQLDSLIIGLTLSTAMVTLYAAAYRLYSASRELSGAFTNALIPEITRAHALQDRARIRSLFLRGSAYANGVTLLIAVPAAVFAEPVLTAWAGDEFGGAARVAQILLVGLVIANDHLVGMAMMIGVGRVRAYTRYHVAWAVANLVLCLALVGPLGLEAVALGTALPLLVLEPFYVRVALRETGVPARDYVRDAVLRPLVPAVALGLAAWALSRTPGLDGLPGALALSAGFAVVYGLVFLRYGADATDRRRVVARLHRLTPVRGA